MRRFLFILFASTLLLMQCSRDKFYETKIPQLDHERGIINSIPTTGENYYHRLNMLDQWTRLLIFAGADIEDYVPFRNAIRKADPTLTDNIFGDKNPLSRKIMLTRDQVKSVEEAFRSLEKIFSNFMKTAEGREFIPRIEFADQSYREWEMMRHDQKNTGSTSDPGPSEGILAWKFASGRPWYSRPSVEDGKIYVASPGMTTILYCLSEDDGTVLWRTPQRGNGHAYGTARINSSVIVSKENCIVRELGSGGNAGIQKHLVFVDKTTGNIVKEEYAGHVDYRVGYSPLEGDQSFIVYPHGIQTIQQATSRTITTFDSLICRSSGSNEILWKEYIGEFWTEPKLDNGQVFVGTMSGNILCINARKEMNRIAWSYNSGARVNSKINVTPALVIASSDDGSVICLDRVKGNLKWRIKIEDPEIRAWQQFSMAEISGNSIYIGCANNQLYCIDLISGKINWHRNLGDWVRSKPLVVDSSVYAATLAGRLYRFDTSGNLLWVKQPTGHQVFADLVAGNGNILLNSSDLYLHCIDATTGIEKWRRSLMEAVYTKNRRVWADIDGGGADFQSPPIVADGMVFTGGPDMFIHALDHHSGKEIWRFEVKGQIPAAPVFYKGRLYFGQQGGTSDYYCISASTGDLVWKRQLGWGWASANVDDGKVYVPTVSGWIYCLNAETGETLWDFNTQNGTYPIPALEENVVVFGSWNSKFYGFNKSTGKMLWEFDIDGNPDSGGAMVNEGKAYLQGLDAKFFFCVELQTGKEIWKFPIPDGFECNMSPCLHNGKVYFSAFRQDEVCMSLVPGLTFCLDAATGKKIWELKACSGLTGISASGDNIYFASTVDPFIWCVDAEGNGNGTTSVKWKFRTNGRAEESCISIAYGKAYVLSTEGYIYAIQ